MATKLESFEGKSTCVCCLTLVQESTPKCHHLLNRLYTQPPESLTKRFSQLISSRKMNQSLNKWGHKAEGHGMFCSPGSGAVCRLHGAKSKLILHSLLFLRSDPDVQGCLDLCTENYVNIFKDTPVVKTRLSSWLQGRSVQSQPRPKPDACGDPSCLTCLGLETSAAGAALCRCFALLEHFSCQRGHNAAENPHIVDDIKVHLRGAGSALPPAAVNTCWYN